MRSLGWGLTLVLLGGLLGCPGDDGGLETTASGPVSTTSNSGDNDSTTNETPDLTTSGIGPGTGEVDSTSSGGMADGSSSSSTAGSSSGGSMACEPPVVGEWNACLNEQGQSDNTLCNWIGNPDGTGFLTCLTNGGAGGGNVCIIRDCEDTCDCFDPPTTGTAEVICDAILSGGGMGCGLDCSAGQTCPDGMMCASGLCFWPDP